MMDLYTLTTYKCSKLITRHYSTSFSLGIKTLNKKYHFPIYAIYGYVRYADEIVDTFHAHNKEELLRKFKADTFQAIEEGISLNPVLHAFQHVVNQYSIEHHLIEAFLHSMEMDLINEAYTESGYETYIYGSAEVVGLMCLRVFCHGNNEQYDSLKEPARRLGAAFQKVNFLRDIKSDFDDRGRIYFPGVNFHKFQAAEKAAIEKNIAEDFAAALIGIKQLPSGARAGVYLAYVYYLQLFKKIKSTPASQILKERIRVPDSVKFLLLGQSMIRNRMNLL